MDLSALLAGFREHPIAVALEVTTLVACVVLFVGTFLALAVSPPTQGSGIWLAVIVVGGALVVLWTVIVPIYERFLY
ncbi:hypothetical protein ACYJ1Y_01420 [Natrialbaceae archaeon A-gly3]